MTLRCFAWVRAATKCCTSANRVSETKAKHKREIRDSGVKSKTITFGTVYSPNRWRLYGENKYPTQIYNNKQTHRYHSNCNCLCRIVFQLKEFLRIRLLFGLHKHNWTVLRLIRRPTPTNVKQNIRSITVNNMASVLKII